MDSPAAPTISPPPERAPGAAALISETVVRLLRHSTGRAPTGASAVIAPDLAIVTLTGCLTKAERTLIEQGQGQITSRVRAAMYQEIRPDAVTTVEAVTGMKVVAYLAAQEYDSDVAFIVFYLDPPDADGRAAL